MKLSIDLEDTYNEECASIAGAIRSELDNAVRREVKNLIKIHEKELRKTVSEVVEYALKNPNVSADILNEYLKQKKEGKK